MADLFTALSDPTRRGILEALRDADAPLLVPALVEAAGSTRQAVNRHLLVLKEVGLVEELGDGPERAYALTPQPLLAVEDWLASFLLGVPADEQDAAPAAAGDWLWPVGDRAERAVAAWAGTEVGGSLGRRVADVRHAVRRLTHRR